MKELRILGLPQVLFVYDLGRIFVIKKKNYTILGGRKCFSHQTMFPEKMSPATSVSI